MSRYVEFTLPDGSTVIMESDERETGVVRGGRPGELAKQATETFEQAAENAGRLRWSCWKKCAACTIRPMKSRSRLG